MAGVGDDVGACGAARARGGRRWPRAATTAPCSTQGVEVAAHRGRREVEVATQLGCGDRPVCGDHVQHPGARARLEGRGDLALSQLTRVLGDKHNTIVT